MRVQRTQDSPGHPVQRGPMQADPAQRDPAGGDPDNRIAEAQIQDNRCVFLYTLMKIYIVVKVFPVLMKYIFEWKKCHFLQNWLILIYNRK